MGSNVRYYLGGLRDGDVLLPVVHGDGGHEGAVVEALVPQRGGYRRVRVVVVAGAVQLQAANTQSGQQTLYGTRLVFNISC